MTDTPEPTEASVTDLLQAQLAAAHAKLLHAELKTHAVRAGMIDLDGLKLFDQTGLALDEEGNLAGAPELLGQMKRDKPWLFVKPNSSHPAVAPAPQAPKVRKAMDMTLDEWRVARERLLKGR